MQTPPPHGDTDAAERVARAVLDTWATHVGPRGTDLVVRNGAVEWTILAGVCLVLDGDRDRDGDGGRVLPIALGTGTKTLPYEAVRSVPGDALHDSHAEVLARRGARRWIAERIMLEASMGGEPEDQQDAQLDGIPRLFQRDDATRRWRLKSNVKVWWYISTLPCESIRWHATHWQPRSPADSDPNRPPSCGLSQAANAQCRYWLAGGPGRMLSSPAAGPLVTSREAV